MSEDRVFIGPMVDNLIDGFVDEIKKKKHKDKLMKTIINPVLKDIDSRYYPYAMALSVLLVTIIVLLVTLLIINVKSSCNKTITDDE